MDYTDLGARLRKLRIRARMTQEELAQEIEVSTSFVGHIERGSRKASLETMVKIANAMKISLDYLLSGSLQQSSIGPLPSGLSEKKRIAMKAILTAIEDNLTAWEA